MNRRRVILLAVVLLLVLGLWWLLRVPHPKPQERDLSSGQTSSPPSQEVTPKPPSPEEREAQQREEKKREVVGQIVASLNTPIEFYGKVVDQNGDPVPDARVGYSLLDRFNASGSNGHIYADGAGNIEIKGVRGAVLGVSVSKEGYYKIHKVSNQRFAYGMGPDGITKAPPTKVTPAVFVLHKMGKTEPLMRVEKNARIPKDGTPVTVNLSNGRVAPDGNLRVEAWTDDQNLNERRRYNWRCRVTVPGGGLVERKGQFDFEAPSDGYEESVELGMPGNAEQWTSQQQRDYFVKLPDGRFARVSFTMIAGGNHYFLLESFLNPVPGSRNLEYDPKQTAATP